MRSTKTSLGGVTRGRSRSAQVMEQATASVIESLEQRLMLAVTGWRETLQVPNNGNTISSSFNLENNRTYRLVATGSVVIQDGPPLRYNDAEYVDPTQGSERDFNASSLDVGVKSSAYNLRWGPFSADHRYEVAIVGNGSPLSLYFADDPYNDQLGNFGYLDVAIYEDGIPDRPVSQVGGGCCCCCGGDDAIDESVGAPTGGQPWNNGVMSGGGDGALESDDLGTGSMGGWSLARTFSTQGGYSTGNNGNGWSPAGGLPAIRQFLDVGGDGTIAVYSSSGTPRLYGKSGTTYTGKFDNRESLSYAYNATAGTLVYALIDTTGQKLEFYGFDTNIPAAQRGTFWRMTNAAGQETARVTTLTVDGKVQVLTRTDSQAGVTETITYTYGTGDGSSGKVVGAVLARGGSTVRQVQYEYYASTDTFGSAGDLKKVTVRDAASNVLDVNYYRYYRSGDANGYAGGLKLAFGSAAYARLTAAVANAESASDSAIASYADHSFEYDAQRRVTRHTVAGEGCSACGTPGQGSYTYTYTQSGNNQPDEWRYKTVETQPDGTQNVTYSNIYGQVILRDGGGLGTEYWQYDGAGRVTLHAHPSAVDGYDEYRPDLVLYSGGLSASDGLIDLYEYASATTATTTTAGDVDGLLKATKVANGYAATPITLSDQDYIALSNGAQSVYRVKHERVYSDTGATNARTTTCDYTLQGSTLNVESLTTTHPVIGTAQNGSGNATADMSFYDKYGRVTWRKDADGFISYTEYDQATGAVTKRIEDVNTSSTGDFANKPSGWTTPSGGGLHLITSYEVDAQGRTTKVIDPGGNVTYVRYNDAAYETRTYPGWVQAGSNYTTTGPVQVTREDRAGGYTESYTFVYQPSAASTPSGTESYATDVANIRSLSRSYLNSGGQTIYVDQYVSLSGLTYTTATALGTQGVHFLRTTYGYEKNGRQGRAVSPDGTIQHSFFDGLGREVAVWQGADDVPSSDLNSDGTIDWRDFRYNLTEYSSAPDGTTMYLVSASSYDLDQVGDGNLTQSRIYYAEGLAYATDHQYDWRDRQVQSRGPDGVATLYTLDNLGEATLTQSYADLDGDFALDTGELRGQSGADYDEQGRGYASTLWAVDPATGVLGHHLTTSMWYDARGMVIKTAQPNGLFSKASHDGIGRTLFTYLGYDADGSDTEGGSAYAGAASVDGDVVIQQARTIYDAASNPVITVSYERYETDTAAHTGALATNDSFVQVQVGWYDAIDRTTASANYGRDNGATVFSTSGTLIDTDADGIPDEAENAAPAPDSSDDYILGQYEYDDAGRPFQTTDNLGHRTRTLYDLAGHTTKTIENITSGDDGIPNTADDGILYDNDSAANRTTEFLYDSAGRLSIRRARNPRGAGLGIEDQDTRYLYESPFSGSLITSTLYPDSADTDSTGTDQVKATYDRLGQLLTSTDQRGVVHEYSYDSAGRLVLDAVTTAPSGVADNVLAIGRTYDDLGRLQTLTSYDGPGDSYTVVNQVKYTIDGWGNLILEEQAHDGEVTAGTPAVTYTYADGADASGNAQYVRLASVTYPSARVIYYNYPISGPGLYLSRIDNLAADASGTTMYAQYTYLGAGRIVRTTHPASANNLTLAYNTGGTGVYSGLDRFGRVVRQLWKDGQLSGGSYDGDLYTYDRNSNIKTKDYQATGVPDDSWDQRYTYDGLDRLLEARRGTLDASSLIGGSDIDRIWDWTLDAQGNWRQYWTVDDPHPGDMTLDGNVDYDDLLVLSQNFNAAGSLQRITGDLNGDDAVNSDDLLEMSQNYNYTGGPAAPTHTRTVNAANEITNISQSGWVTPAYDDAGNMISGPKAGAEGTRLHFTYDAWNRLVWVYSDDGNGQADDLIASYEYDGASRRVQKTLGEGESAVVQDVYFNEGWQVLEVRQGGDPDPLDQYLWDLSYVDTPVLRFHDGNRDGDVTDITGEDPPDNTLYYMTDVNHNVTGLYDGDAGITVERYFTDQYGGRVIVFDRTWVEQVGGTAYANPVQFGGYWFDQETGNNYARNRYYNPTVGAWICRDPAGYADENSVYQYVCSNPTVSVDPAGLQTMSASPNTLDPDYAAAYQRFQNHHSHPASYGDGRLRDQPFKSFTEARAVITAASEYHLRRIRRNMSRESPPRTIVRANITYTQTVKQGRAFERSAGIAGLQRDGLGGAIRSAGYFLGAGGAQTVFAKRWRFEQLSETVVEYQLVTTFTLTVTCGTEPPMTVEKTQTRDRWIVVDTKGEWVKDMFGEEAVGGFEQTYIAKVGLGGMRNPPRPLPPVPVRIR